MTPAKRLLTFCASMIGEDPVPLEKRASPTAQHSLSQTVIREHRDKDEDANDELCQVRIPPGVEDPRVHHAVRTLPAGVRRQPRLR